MEDTVVEEVREGHVVTLEEPSTTVANTVTSSEISKRHRTRMRRRSGKLPTTNHRSNRHLKMDKRKNWLRKQNRLLRKKRAAEKRKPCQRRRVEEQQKKAAEARKAQSAKKVSACMKDKLSKRREQEECNQVWNQADKIATVIHQTFVLELPDKPITVKVTSKDHPPALAKCEKHLPKGEFATTVNVVSEKCSAEPRASTATLSGTGIYAHCSPRTANTATNRPKNRQPPTTILLSQNEFQPTSVDQETCAPYDNWLSMKSCQTAASRCQDDQALSRHDAAENDLIRQVVRRRVEDIAAGKSRVCIGTRISNSETTEAFPRVTRTHLNATFGNSNSNQEGQAITDDYDARSHTKRTGHALHVTALHGNARTMRRLMQSLNLFDGLPSRITTTANISFRAFPARLIGSSGKQVAVSRTHATKNAENGNSDNVQVPFITGNSFTVKKLQAFPMCMPILKPAKADRVVNYQQRSRSKFFDYKSESECIVPIDRPEPVGSDKPDVADVKKILSKLHHADDLLSKSLVNDFNSKLDKRREADFNIG